MWKHFKGGVLLEVAPDGRVLWEHRDPRHHHDARRTAGGGVVYLTVEPVPKSIAAQVRGGVPGSGARGMWADVIVEVDAHGKRIWEWKSWGHLDPALDIITANDARDEWSHGNTLITEGSFGRIFQVTPAGEVVWEYINPHFNRGPDGSLTNAVFRAVHYLPKDLPWLKPRTVRPTASAPAPPGFRARTASG